MFGNLSLILILAAAIFFYYHYKKNKGKPKKYLWSGIFLVLSLIFLEPSPDIISFGIYSIIHNIDISTINASNIANHFWDFQRWSIPIGLLFLFVAGFLLGKDWKKEWNKISPGRYGIALVIAFAAVLLVGYLDVLSANSGVFGNFIEYTNGNYAEGWWNVFFKFALIIFAIPAICYYFFVNRDVSESIGVFTFSYILYWGGWSDIFYFVSQGLAIPSELPWLMGSPFISFVSNGLGYSTVNPTSLLMSAFLSLIIAWIVAKVMKEKF